MAGIKDATDQALIAELESRGLVVSVWSVEDALQAIRPDTEGDGLDMGEEQVRAGAALFLERAAEGLKDVLGQRGNDYLSERVDDLGPGVWEDVYGTSGLASKGP